MNLLVSDANILIDMDDGGLLSSMFSLSRRFITPDTLFEGELKDRHGSVLTLGLELVSLTPESMGRVIELAQHHPAPSRIDLFAVALAEQELCPLLTGDKDCRTAAEREGIEVHGTIWLVEEQLRQGKITADVARAAYERMREAGSRLPWARAFSGLAKF